MNSKSISQATYTLLEQADILHLPQSDYKEALNNWIDKYIDGECKAFSASAKNFRKNWFLAMLRSLTYTAYYRRNGITYKTSFNNGFCESKNKVNWSKEMHSAIGTS